MRVAFLQPSRPRFLFNLPELILRSLKVTNSTAANPPWNRSIGVRWKSPIHCVHPRRRICFDNV
jgi:hypothetical protein